MHIDTNVAHLSLSSLLIPFLSWYQSIDVLQLRMNLMHDSDHWRKHFHTPIDPKNLRRKPDMTKIYTYTHVIERAKTKLQNIIRSNIFLPVVKGWVRVNNNLAGSVIIKWQTYNLLNKKKGQTKQHGLLPSYDKRVCLIWTSKSKNYDLQNVKKFVEQTDVLCKFIHP